MNKLMSMLIAAIFCHRFRRCVRCGPRRRHERCGQGQEDGSLQEDGSEAADDKMKAECKKMMEGRRSRTPRSKSRVVC